ncbi:MAG: flagellar basal body rod C-terminal domain-containing protein, partial [Succinivibrio sp.]
TFTEGYASLTSRLGSAAYEANNNLTAATSKQAESQELYESDAGVNLDEEAAALIQYQQSYQACAKIINASQTIFDSLLAAF